MDHDEIDIETRQKIEDRKLKNAVIKVMRRDEIEAFKIKIAIGAIAALYTIHAANYIDNSVGNLINDFSKKKAMEVVSEEDWSILIDKDNRYEGLMDQEGYPRAFGYNHYNIAQKLNMFYAGNQDLGDVHLADIAKLMEYDDNDVNIDRVFNWVDDQYVGDAKSYKEYYQKKGFQNEEEYYQAMVDLNYELSQKQEDNFGGPKL